MISRNWKLGSLYGVFFMLVLAVMLVSCGDDDNGNGEVHFGRVEGAVYLPFGLAAAPQPAVGVVVNLAGGDYSQNKTTDANGRYGFDDAPARAMTLTLTPAACLADTQIAVTVLPDDTISVDVTLAGDAAGDCLSLPFGGAVRMEIDPLTNTAVLLYDTSTVRGRLLPAIAVVDLSTGAVETHEFNDIANVFDLAFVSTNLVVFNCLKPGDGHYLRFFDIGSMAVSGSDVMYTTNTGNLPGRIAVTPTGTDVFVTHRVVQSGFIGQIFCVSVAQRNLQDADNEISDLNFAFDADLVANALIWPYALAIDAVSGELLVSDYQDTVVVAIEMARWGTFDRSANLTAPIPGVRKMAMSTGVAGYKPFFLGFAGTTGIAAHPSYGILSYQSGGSTHTNKFVDPDVSLTAPTHHLAIHLARGTWYTLVTDPDRPQSIREAVEERSLTTLTKTARYESQFQETPAFDPRAFAVNTLTNKVYVAYANKAILEVFDLQ